MIRKPLVALAVFAATLVLLPAIAGAHVEIEADDPPAADGAVNATVFAENECTAKLANVELTFPESPELTAVSAEPVDGWTAVVTKKSGSEAVEKIVWTNTAAVDGDGDFPVTLGPVDADVTEIDFKALDTCDDGEVTRWVQEGEDSDYPAPVLAITATEDAGGSDTSTTTQAADTESDDDSSNTGLIVGIVIAVVVVGGGIAYAVSRRKG
jgi:uncharacterized protein YcnI